MKNLYVIDGLINAYTLRKIEVLETNAFDIMVVVNTNLYEPEEFTSAIKSIVFPLVCDKMFITSDNDWVHTRNRSLRKKIEMEIMKSGLSDDIIQGYEAIYLNPFTSGVAAVLSTKGVKTHYLSHGSFDLFRFINFHYHAIKIWISTGIFIVKGSSCYGMVDLKRTRDSFINITNMNKSSSTSGVNLEQQYSPDILNKNLLKLKNERLLLLLWTQRDEGKNRDFNKPIIHVNLKLIRAFFERHPSELGKLVCLVKCHKSFHDEYFELFQEHIKEFEFYFKEFVFFHNVNPSKFSRFIPVELLVDALSPVYMVGSSSSAIWNCAGRKGLTVYHAFLYRLDITKLSRAGQRVYKKLFKKMAQPPWTLK